MTKDLSDQFFKEIEETILGVLDFLVCCSEEEMFQYLNWISEVDSEIIMKFFDNLLSSARRITRSLFSKRDIKDMYIKNKQRIRDKKSIHTTIDFLVCCPEEEMYEYINWISKTDLKTMMAFFVKLLISARRITRSLFSKKNINNMYIKNKQRIINLKEN